MSDLELVSHLAGLYVHVRMPSSPSLQTLHRAAEPRREKGSDAHPTRVAVLGHTRTWLSHEASRCQLPVQSLTLASPQLILIFYGFCLDLKNTKFKRTVPND